MANTICIHPNDLMTAAVFSRRRWTESPKDRWIGFGFSLSMHAVLIFVGGMMLIKPIEFGVDRGLSAMDVQLIAGSNESVVTPVQEIKPDIPQEVVKNPEAVQTPEPEKVQEVKPIAQGNSAVTATSTNQGAETEIKPFYLNNPAPHYPYEARQKGWEGTVLLMVQVDNNGKPISVDIEQTSGHKVLDDAAVKAVKTWNFRPASLGGLKVESSVEVPVRFDLQNP